MADRLEEAHLLLRISGRDNTTFQILVEHPKADLGMAIFHGQQAVEKAIKAVLSANRIIFPPTHNLLVLAKLVESAGLALPVDSGALERLTPYAVTVRYDDREIHTLTKDAARSIVDAILTWATAHIPPEPQP